MSNAVRHSISAALATGAVAGFVVAGGGSRLAMGIVALAESDVHVPVNIGNPNEFTLLELAEAVIEVTGSKSEIVYEALPTDDPKQRRPNIERAKEMLGWEPKTELIEGLKKTIDQTGRGRLIGDGA